jgi:hypothetical protein
MNNPFLLIASAIVLSGCGAGPYIEPTDSSSATLLLENHANSKTSVRFSTFDDAENCSVSTFRLIGVNGTWPSEPGQSGTVRIKPEAFTLKAWSPSGSVGRGDCQVGLTFTPKPNTAYVATFSGDFAGCKLGIYQIDASGNRTREYARQRYPIAGMANNGHSCK